MTHLDDFEDCDPKQTAGTKRGKLRNEEGLGFTKSSPIQTQLIYLKMAAKLKTHLLQQILLLAKDYRIMNRSTLQFFKY